MGWRDRVRGWVDRLEPRPRLVDWSILAFVLLSVGTGLLSLSTGSAREAVVFWAHGVAGLTLVALLGYKLKRVRRRVVDRRRWDRATPLSLATAAVAVGALLTGAFWSSGGNVPVWAWTTLNLHVLLGLLVLPLALAHLWTRFRRPRRVDFEGRRTALQYGALLVGGALLWRLQRLVVRLSGATAGRFTGSRPVETLYPDAAEGSFPVTSWVADDPDPVDWDAWRLAVRGRVGRPFDLRYGDLATETTRRATLDCTSGWYTVQDWRGVRVGDLLDRAAVADDARYVRFVSVTGYRWSLPLAEARDALLATHVGDDRLSHGHGAPLRLVAPGRRGFQWVKWVERVEVRRRGDPAQWLVTLVSGFD